MTRVGRFFFFALLLLPSGKWEGVFCVTVRFESSLGWSRRGVRSSGRSGAHPSAMCLCQCLPQCFPFPR